jgi:hypothetical protein
VDVRAVSCFRCVFRDVCEWADLGYALYSAGGGGAYEGGERCEVSVWQRLRCRLFVW